MSEFSIEMPPDKTSAYGTAHTGAFAECCAFKLPSVLFSDNIATMQPSDQLIFSRAKNHKPQVHTAYEKSHAQQVNTPVEPRNVPLGAARVLGAYLVLVARLSLQLQDVR